MLEEGISKEYPLEQFFFNSDQNKILFLKNQLLFFANLCLNRNYNCVQYLQNILPLNTMISYSLNLNLDIEFRACFCKLIQNIYIDKEPRIKRNKPNLIRILQNVAKPEASIPSLHKFKASILKSKLFFKDKAKQDGSGSFILIFFYLNLKLIQ